MRIAASFVLLAACSDPSSWVPAHEPVSAPADAEALAEEAWLAVRGEGPAPAIVWTVGCIEATEPVGCWPGAYYADSGTAYVQFKHEVWNSSLVHELTHAALARRGDSDGAHAGPEWNHVRGLNQEMCRDHSDDWRGCF